MATFKAEIQNKRADGTYNIRIRITHNRQVRRLSTNMYLTDADLTKSRKIKNDIAQEQLNAILSKCREYCNAQGFALFNMTIDELAENLRIFLMGGKRFTLDFIEYAEKKARAMKPSTGRTYLDMNNALRRFLKSDNLDISKISTQFLREFEAFLAAEPSQRGNNRKEEKGAILKPKGGRAVSKYLASVRAIHNMAKREFNDEDRGVTRIPYSPFKNFKIKSQPQTRKRALPISVIQKIIDLPYEKDIIGGRQSRYNLAKDCFILSFALVGMNSADMYHAGKPKDGIIVYDRKKTADRRNDRAEMHIKAEYCIQELLNKYRDDKKLFRFYRHYADHTTFNAAINRGLKMIGAEIGVDDLEFYAARHSWATIARSSAGGVDKATVHEALNHVDSDMKVTDIYIDRDWSVIWEANKKVLSLFDWSGLELMYLL